MRNIIILIGSLLTAFTMPMSLLKISNEKFNFKEIIKATILLFPMLVINYLFFEGVLKLILTILIFTICIYFSIFYKDISKSFFYSLIYEFLACITEIIICVIELVILKFDFNNYSSSPIFILITTIINISVVYAFCNINPLKNLVKKMYNIILKNTKIWLFLTFLTILIFLLVAFNWYNFNNNLHFYINVTMIIFVVVVLLFMIKNTLKSAKLENNYNEMMEYVQKYEKIINEQGKKNHEYNNQLTVIRGYSHNPKKLEEYLDTIIEDHKCGQNYTIRQLSNFPDGGIKGLIYHKLGKMDDNNIKYYLYIDSDSKNIFEKKFNLKTYQDITKLLGVFLDNAIDASKEAKEKEVELDIKNEDNCIIITLSNTFNNNIDSKQIGKKGFTTKGKGHGYGLSIVKDINKHNENIETFNDIEDDKFTQTILIYYK